MVVDAYKLALKRPSEKVEKKFNATLACLVEVSPLPTINSVKMMRNIINETHSSIWSMGVPSLGGWGRRERETYGTSTFWMWDTLKVFGLICYMGTDKI